MSAAARLRRGNRPDRVADGVHRVVVGEVFHPRDDARLAEQGLFTVDPPAEDVRVVRGGECRDVVSRQAAWVMRLLRRTQFLRVQNRQGPSKRGSGSPRPLRFRGRSSRGKRATPGSRTPAGGPLPAPGRRGQLLRLRWRASRQAASSPVVRNTASASRDTYSSYRSKEATMASSKCASSSGGNSAARSSFPLRLDPEIDMKSRQGLASQRMPVRADCASRDGRQR